MIDLDRRAAVVAAARGWLGTRWQHQGRVRGVGVDCVGLVIEAAVEAGVFTRAAAQAIEAAVAGYGREPDGLRLQQMCDAHLQPIALQTAAAGDVLLFAMGSRLPRHMGLVAEHAAGGLSLVHATADARAVVEHRLDESWRSRVVQAYAFAEAA